MPRGCVSPPPFPVSGRMGDPPELPDPAPVAQTFFVDEEISKRYRLDALQSLAKKLKVPFEDVKKKDLVAAILASDQKLIPLK